MRLEFLQAKDDGVFLILGAVSCGAPNEITGEITPIKLLEFLSGDSSGVFVLAVHGDSMFPEIQDGDCIVINSNRAPKFGEKIVASVGGEYTLKTYKNSSRGLRLVASNGKFPTRQITEKDNFETVGVVSHVIKKI
ncbi:MAG: S24 family peptidase [Acidobacteriota bacterium]|nr:S24 family peptidase [Acidobacteriota bacterium]